MFDGTCQQGKDGSVAFSKEKLERRKTFSGWKRTELDERKSPHSHRFALSEQNKASTSTAQHNRGGGYNCALARKPLSFRLSTLPSNNKPIEKFVYVDHVYHSTRAKDVTSQPCGLSHSRNDESLTSPSTQSSQLSTQMSNPPDRSKSKRASKFPTTRVELELAIKKDERSRLLLAIQCKTVNLDEKDYYGKTLLHTACTVGNYHCAQILIDAGSTVDIQDHAGFTPLHCAVLSNHVPCAAVLIASGADLMASTNTMHTMLTLAHEDEMILLIGRSLLLRGMPSTTIQSEKHRNSLSLKETNL